jgi:hypothetical protein
VPPANTAAPCIKGDNRRIQRSHQMEGTRRAAGMFYGIVRKRMVLMENANVIMVTVSSIFMIVLFVSRLINSLLKINLMVI